MLNEIKAMIKQQTDYLEAAQLLFEDGTESALDDSIILGEETEDPEVEDIKEEDEGEEEIEDTDDSEEEKEDKKDDEEDKDIMDEPLDDESEDEDKGEDDLLNSSIGDDGEPPLPLPGDNSLPTPVGRQTGEPISGDMDDILSLTLDMRSNTARDVLPIPPSNAAEAINDDSLLSQKIDSGFGDDTPPAENNMINTTPNTEGGSEGESDLLDSSLDDGGNGSQFTEAINIGDETSTSDNGGTAAEEPPVDGGEVPPDENNGADSPEPENDVTSAVRDKVAEMDDQTSGTTKDSKEDLLKKLGNITKSLEDAKKAVMSAIQ